jgi:general secretion pathway protein G
MRGCRALYSRRAPAFTIVELLIVIVVIGILAAISIVAYVGITNSAYNAAVKNDLTNFAKKMEIIKAQTGAYPDGTAFTKDMGFAFSRTSYGLDYQLRNLRYCLNPATDNYIMYARSKSRRYFKYTASSGLSIAEDKFGYEVCSQIGLVTTNPSTNGLYDTTWADWVN